MKYILVLLSAVSIISCQKEQPQKWQHTQTINLEGVNPIGLVATEDGFWFSDGDHNRLVHTNTKGEIITTLDSFERPMHLAISKDRLYVPEYGRDTISIIYGDMKEVLKLNDSLDAPAGISVYNKEIAIADFYSNRIFYAEDGEKFINFGSEGRHEGELYYPTDVQITKDKIYVADAYNHRVQVFDKQGTFLKMIGVEQNMNAATGLFVSETELFVTDFENDRVLVFDLDGNLKQELSEHIEKPTDMIIKDSKLYIVNYRNGHMNVFQLGENGNSK